MLAAIETEAQERFRQAEAAHSARGEYMCEQREAHQKHARELGSAARNHADGARQEAQRHHGQVYHLDTQRTRTEQRHPFEQTASKAQLGLAVQSARRIQHDKANQRERECNSIWTEVSAGYALHKPNCPTRTLNMVSQKLLDQCT
ncbi:hypothetical protein HBI88_216700 [Parastagonospora nodorum]|nr:hypothetical protein HBI27_224610 [Parastagonospora nodorum]KAH5752741.1 hypothetical protein HBI97_227650 [Parastagonospora nodorum]KAH5789030.1 hypothetical protein HBI96_219640 [Parastagonospora nodorum]KAH5800892.1 hypothetical protein HBI94_216010 [Parastagonospora nodorum]KAH5813395.1 hypothetical protein HBI93_215530 [Parastagonospora nodorum]